MKNKNKKLAARPVNHAARNKLSAGPKFIELTADVHITMLREIAFAKRETTFLRFRLTAFLQLETHFFGKLTWN